MLQAVWLSLAGALVYLDTTAVAQFMICQPLIACPLWGWLVGRPEIGLFFGVAFQLLYLGSLPIGAARFPEGNVGALVATALAARVPAGAAGEPAWLTLAVATLVGVLTAHAGSRWTPVIRHLLAGYSGRVVEAARAGRRARFTSLFLGAIGVHALGGFLLTFVMFWVGKAILALYLGNFATAGISPAVVAQTDRYLSGLWPGFVGAGVAVVAARYVHRATLPYFVLAAAVAFGAGWLWL
jgi:mannose/fructose/N-acetylgalactosamine-specific phosphotransferase system component IIC